MKNEKQEIVGFAVRKDSRGRGRIEKVDNSGLVCSHCQSSGHDANSCFLVVGYPDWWEERYGPPLKLEAKGASGPRGKPPTSRSSPAASRS